MGAINYGGNYIDEGFINIGLNLSRFSSPITIMRRVSMMQEIINDYNGSWFKVNVEPGYYDGAWVSIEWDEETFAYSEQWTLEEIRAEIARLGDILGSLVKVGCVEYFPDWCTGYSTAAETRVAIKKSYQKLYNYYQKVCREEEDD